MIEIFDNVLKEDLHKKIFTLVRTKPYQKVELDNPDQRPSEATNTYNVNGSERDFLIKSLPCKANVDIANYEFLRVYYNAFYFGDTPDFHTDSENPEDITLLYYPNLKWHTKLGSETMFVPEGNDIGCGQLYAITPVPNRLIKFNSTLIHSARPPLYQHLIRYSIAFKLTPKG